jgi:hypothetical protein
MWRKLKNNVPHLLISALGIEPNISHGAISYHIIRLEFSQYTYSYNATDEYFAHMGYIANFLCVDLKAETIEL